MLGDMLGDMLGAKRYVQQHVDASGHDAMAGGRLKDAERTDGQTKNSFNPATTSFFHWLRPSFASLLLLRNSHTIGLSEGYMLS